MTLHIHHRNPAETVEAAYFRIHQERMLDVPILNLALAVEAIDFQRWQDHWLGVVVTPWCMSLLLVPGSTENWVSTGENKRRFVKFPAGEFAFLGSVEAELGEFQSCSLFSPMGKFSTQSEATLTARASMSALLTPPAPPPVAPLAAKGAASSAAESADQRTLSRRRFFALRKPSV